MNRRLWVVLGFPFFLLAFGLHSEAPPVEALLHHDLLAVTLKVDANANVSKENDNQAEVTIAIDPTKTTNLFAASVTWHGSILGKFDSKVDVKKVWKDHTPGRHQGQRPTTRHQHRQHGDHSN